MNRWIIRVLVVLAIAALVFILPFTTNSSGLGVIAEIAIFTVLLASANVLTGVAGQISVGQGAFFGVGAYTTAVLTGTYGWSPESALPVAVLAAFLIGLLAGLPSLRISGMYLALTTLAIALVFPTVVVKLAAITGGADGIRVSGLKAPSWFWATDRVWVYTVFVLIALLVLLGMRNLIKGSAGRALIATRDYPLMATAMGVDVRMTKISAFGLSGVVAGLAGWMFAVNGKFISPSDFGVLLSINVLVGMYIGGAASVAGPVIGAFFIRSLPDVVYDTGVNPILVPLVTGLLLIFILKFLPDGLASAPRRIIDVVRKRRSPLPDPPPTDPARPVLDSLKN